MISIKYDDDDDNDDDFCRVGVGGMNWTVSLNVFRLPPTVADSIHTARRDATVLLRHASNAYTLQIGHNQVHTKNLVKST